MALVCSQVTEWVEQHVSKRVEDWENGTEKKCKKHHWYDPRSWFCWLVVILVKVIRWVVVTVVTAVFTIVCNVVADALSIAWDLLKFLGNLFVALVTWDKCRLQRAIGNLADAVIGAFETIGDVLVRPIIDRIQTYRLRNFVRDAIEERYAGQDDLIDAVKQNVNVDSGVFGYRLTVTIHRMFVDSETRTKQSGDVPNLIYLHEAGLIDLYQLAGFGDGCAIFSKDGWRRSLPRTAQKVWAGGSGLIDDDPPEITRGDLDAYISTRGAGGTPFLILAMSTRMLNNRIKAAKVKGRQLGLLLDFDTTLREVTDHQFMNYRNEAFNIVPVDCSTKQKDQQDFLICELGRTPDTDFLCCDIDAAATNVAGSPDAAAHDLCKPVAVGVFRYAPDNPWSGWTTNLVGTQGYAHDLADELTSGVSFRAQIPEEGRMYVLIHELGHYFGLTHVDGFDRIMVSGESGQGSFWTVRAFPNFILLHGGPRFIFTEAKRVWNFILKNFPAECLAPGHAEPAPAPAVG